MAIRAPPPKPEQLPSRAPGVTRQQPASPAQRMVDFGSARTPQEARRLVSDLLAGLRAAGFPVAKTGNADAELSQALKLFQRDNALGESGVLDKETHDALVDHGHIPDRPQKNDAGDAKDAGRTARADAPARFDISLKPKVAPGGAELGLPHAGDGTVPDGAKSAQSVELEQLVDKNARDAPPELDLKSFLSSLRASGFAGTGKGAEQLKDALKKLQKAEDLPQTGQLDPKTADALVRRGIVDERALPLTTAPKDPPAETARTSSPDAQSDPTTRGAKESAPDAVTGRGDPVAGEGSTPGERAGEPGAARGEPGTPASGGSGAPATGNGDLEDAWIAGQDGNAPAGDDDVDDLARGHANVVDEEDAAHEEGHWEVASLAEQIAAGLAAIVRDDDTGDRRGTGAATYAWDFSLFRPGVYGSKQPAEKLFHLVVAKADAFDPLWEKARAALNDKLAALEPDAEPVDVADFTRALRVARYRPH